MQGSLKHLVIRSARPAPQQQLHVHQTAEAPSCGSEVDLQVPGQSPGSQRHYSKVADPQRSGSQGQKEYLVTIVVTSSTSVDALQPLADALVAHVPQVRLSGTQCYTCYLALCAWIVRVWIHFVDREGLDS